MNKFLKNAIKEVEGASYIRSIPVEDFKNMDEVTLFVRMAKSNNCGVIMNYETSNFHQGVLVQLYDKKTCDPRDLLEEQGDGIGVINRWIPCSKRLPLIPEGADDQKFIVMIYGADEPTILNCNSYGTWHDDDGNIYDVTAWQLFPESYIR